MLVILKIPVVYLGAVVWWAIRAEPRPLAGAVVTASLDAPPGCDWGRAHRRRPRPAGGRRGGRLVGARRTALARAQSARTVSA